METRILVTGGSGFIGTNLIEALEKRPADILSLDLQPPMKADHGRYWRRGDIMDAPGLRRLFEEFRPTHVVHLAARCDCDEQTTVERGYRANTDGTANVLAAIKAVPGMQRVVITSTQFVFDKGPLLPRGDEDYHPVTVYGQSKIVTERLTRQAGLTCCWTLIRPTTIWGPWHLRYAQQFFKILRMGLYLHPGREPVLRSYGYVGNVVDQIIRILEAEPAKVNGKTLYVGDSPSNLLDWVNGFALALTGKEARVIPRHWLRLMARMGDGISKLTGTPFFITSSRFRSMTDDYVAPMDATFSLLGPARFSLQEGVRETLTWLEGRAQR